ncbi:hypothetical protein B566_EDAN005551 [Ephemera danica]|nr:hypothetical protein B566_EDAN005551 [Ephemera danica]
MYKMPKRKLEEELEEDWESKESKVQNVKVGVKKNSLDSDEDESDTDDKQYQILESDDIEGQEEGTAQFDGNVRITPFNMKEEMEEGHFDADGDDSSSDGDEAPFDLVAAYTKILKYLQPGETVAKALRRLGEKHEPRGGATLTASQKLKLKKQGVSLESAARDSTAMLELTELANGLLNSTGNMNLVHLDLELWQRCDSFSSQIAAKSTAAKPKEEAEVLDMYADDFDEKEKARLTEGAGSSKNGEPAAAEATEMPSSSQDLAGVDDVAWEFKWSEASEEIHGPHTSSQMQQWVSEGYFKDSVCVRKVGAGGNFYSCRRVDFELYI